MNFGESQPNRSKNNILLNAGISITNQDRPQLNYTYPISEKVPPDPHYDYINDHLPKYNRISDQIRYFSRPSSDRITKINPNVDRHPIQTQLNQIKYNKTSSPNIHPTKREFECPIFPQFPNTYSILSVKSHPQATIFPLIRLGVGDNKSEMSIEEATILSETINKQTELLQQLCEKLAAKKEPKRISKNKDPSFHQLEMQYGYIERENQLKFELMRQQIEIANLKSQYQAAQTLQVNSESYYQPYPDIKYSFNFGDYPDYAKYYADIHDHRGKTQQKKKKKKKNDKK